MGIIVRVKASRSTAYYNKPTQVAAIIRLVPNSLVSVKKVKYVFLIDNSPSMKKEGKLGIAISALHKLVMELPMGNSYEVYYFSNDLAKVYEGVTGAVVSANLPVSYGGTTNLYKALTKMLSYLAKVNVPVRLIILSDGKPTDKRRPSDYDGLQVPANVQIISIGVGNDYNEVIMKKLADKGNGRFYHVVDVKSLPAVFESERVDQVAAYNVRVALPSGAEVINYAGNPVTFPFINNTVSIYAYLNVPPGEMATTVYVSVAYVEPADNSEKVVNVPLTFARAQDSAVEASVDQSVEDEVRYFALLKLYSEKLEEGSKEATQIAMELAELAAKTKREDLVAATRKFVSEGDSKDLLAETTKVLRKG
ncbi:MAG: vWA domain-containing protein [Thermoprotei archaeon]